MRLFVMERAETAHMADGKLLRHTAPDDRIGGMVHGLTCQPLDLSADLGSSAVEAFSPPRSRVGTGA